MTFTPLDWDGIEQAMKHINLGIEYGVLAECRVQNLKGDISLCYAKKVDGKWGFCDSSRQPITLHPPRLQMVLWQMLPDLILTLCEEADLLVERMQHAVKVLQPFLDEIDSMEEERERNTMIGLS